MEEKEVEISRFNYLSYFAGLFQNIRSKAKEQIAKKTEPLKTKLSKTPDKLKDFFFEKDLQLPSELTVNVHAISKSFAKPLFKNTSFKVTSGDIFGIIGLSGSGKTTLLNILVGFIEPDEGTITLEFSKKNSTSVSDSSKYVKILFGFSTQTPSFYGKLTVFENLMHFAALYNIAFNQREKRCNELIEAVGLTDSKNALGHNLSIGMQKRLDIACALIHKPKLLVLDEPTADLDPFTQIQIWNLIKKIHDEKTTIILTSHSLAEVEFLCSKVLILGKKTNVVDIKDSKKTDYSVEVVLEQEFSGKMPKKKIAYSSYAKRNNVLTFTSQSPDKLIKFLTKLIQKNGNEIKSFNVSKCNIKEQFEACIT